MQPVMTLIMNITVVVVVLLGSRLILKTEMLPGDISSFIMYVTQILMSLVMVTFMLMFSSRALASARRIREVMDEKLDLTDADATQKDLQVKQGAITFKNVSFRYYKNSEEKVLNNINLEIPAGATVGIIGSTGCGKTTLVSMIPRLYDCDEGEVLVDGVNVKDYSLYNLREGVSMVLQKNTLFSGTVAENLRWGDENASDEEIRRMAQYAQADKFVSTFKDGYDSQIEQGGANVSGGQKQRLCIARAVATKPEILIFDDSFSALDYKTDKTVRGRIAEQLPDTTRVIIAQRVGTIMDADQIVVLDNGKMVGIGKHYDLVRNCPVYQEIALSQLSKEELGL